MTNETTAADIDMEVYEVETSSTQELLWMRLGIFEQIADLQATLEVLDKAILNRLAGRFEAARKIAGRPFGEVGTVVDGFEVRARFERNVTWDQQRLAEANTRWPMLINIKYSANENAAGKAASEAKQAIEDARTVTYGAQILSVTERSN